MSLKKSAVSGIKWTGSSAVVTTALQFIRLAVLARLLSPNDFGLMAMLMIIIGLAQSLSDMGISNAIIHRQDIDAQQLSSLYWLNIIAGIIVFFIVLLSTPVVAWVYGEPILQEIIPWASAIFLILPWAQQHQILLQKELNFKAISVIRIAGDLIGLAVAIIAAYRQQGVLSLVFGQLAAAMGQTVLFLYVGTSKGWGPRFHFAKKDLQEFLSFGLYQMGEKILAHFISRIDQFFIGILVNAEALGYYNLAFNLTLQPQTVINPIITRVAFPLFAKMQNDNERLKRGYLLTLNILSTINFPFMMGLAVVAPTFIPLVIGDQWNDAVALVQILALVGLLRSTANPVGSLLLAKGRADLGFKLTLGVFFLQILCIYLAGHYGGLFGITIAVLGVQIFRFVLVYLVAVRNLIGPCLVDYFSAMAPSFYAAVVMTIILTLVPVLLRGDIATITIAQISLGVSIYVLFTYLFRRDFTTQLVTMMFKQ